MNKIIPIVVLCAAAFLTTIMLQGCGSKASASTHIEKIKSSQKHLSSFLDLHNKFCEKKYASSDNLIETLKGSPALKPAKDFDGVYEVLINNVSIAITPEKNGCTTDMMIMSNNKELFSFEDINLALLSLGYIETGKAVSSKGKGSDETELMVIEKIYISPNGEVTTLDFPLEEKDKYYMTLFAKKFKEARQKTKEGLLMASR